MKFKIRLLILHEGVNDGKLLVIPSLDNILGDSEEGSPLPASWRASYFIGNEVILRDTFRVVDSSVTRNQISQPFLKDTSIS